jgi:hypothetical protein
MPKVETEQFLKMSRYKNSYFQWEKDGRTSGWIHPKIGWWSRIRHQSLPVPPSEGKEKWGFKSFNCAVQNCPLCQLKSFLEMKMEEYSSKGKFNVVKHDFVILTGEDTEGKVRNFSFVDLVEIDRERFRKAISAFNEVLIPWIRLDDRDIPVVIITAKPSLGSEIRRIVERQIEKRGQKKGDPLISPYAFEFNYDRKEIPSKRYAAVKLESDEAVIDDEVEKIMGMSAKKLNIDMKSLCDPDDPDEIMDLLEAIWDEDSKLTFAQFKKFRKQFAESSDDDEDKDDEEEKPKKKAGRPKKEPDEDKDDDDDDDDDDDEDKDDDDDDDDEDKDDEDDDEDKDDEDDKPDDDKPDDDEDEEEKPKKKKAGRPKKEPDEDDDEDKDDEDEEEKPKKGKKSKSDDDDDEPIYKKMKNRKEKLEKNKGKEEDVKKHKDGGKKKTDSKREKVESGSRSDNSKRKKGDSDSSKSRKKSTFCKSCDMKVIPTSTGLCPECAEELDVKY